MPFSVRELGTSALFCGSASRNEAVVARPQNMDVSMV
jgi:hypothetical protein